MNLPRSSGILLHPTSLPGPFGIGDLGPEAYRFVDFLHETGQRLWQVLPLNPPGYGNCPYMSFSAFAGNPLLMSPEKLKEEGLLSSHDLAVLPTFPEDYVDYERISPLKNSLLRKSFQRFKTKEASEEKEAFEVFCKANAHWLEEYSVFMTLKEYYGGHRWTEWERDFTRQENSSLRPWAERFSYDVTYHHYVQYQFFKQWSSLKSYANEKGIAIIGDLPIYVAHDSADVWSHPDLFQLDEKGNPLVVAGVPPDYFSKTGQLWGNPIYHWEGMAKTGYRWWIERFQTLLTLVDIVRIDHFRGFDAYWEVPASEKNAVKGRWVKGPGAPFFETLRNALGDLPIIAEDLGLITPQVHALRDQFGFPGMKVLQFSFGGNPKDLPDYYPENCVVYTGTHDNNTTVGWFRDPRATTQSREELKKERERLLTYLKTDGSQIHWDLIRLALSSEAQMAMIPMQDLLGLGSEARMNVPGRTNGNWRFRFIWDQVRLEIKEKLKRLTVQSGRG